MALTNTTDIEAQTHSVAEHQSAITADHRRSQPTVTADPRPVAQPTNPTHFRPPDTANSQPQATSAGDRHQNAPASQIADNSDPQRGEKYGDSSDRLWSMYLTKAEKQDKDITESWKGDTEGILVFTGLFSATVAAFIIESYKQLSPNPGDTTNTLLTQISGQLLNISNGTPLTSVVVETGQPFTPTASAVRVNVLWFLSLVLSLTCALSATLMQQWARRYQELAQDHGAPHRRAPIRAYIFGGIKRFGMARAIATMPALLHISVFLFFAGLIEFLFPIDTTVSYSTLGCVVAFVLAYAMLTVLPNLHLNCPYATPLSGVTWRLSQIFVVAGLKAALGIEEIFSNSLLKLWRRINQHSTGPGGGRWRKVLKNQVKVHQQWLFDGLRTSIERNSKDAPSVVVADALKWTLTVLDDDKEIETFVAGVPGFFDSRTVSDATSAILSLMSEKPPFDAILGSRLYDLLKTCIPGISPLNDEERKRRLRVCLKCLCYIGREYNNSGSKPLPPYFPNTLASPEIIRCIQTERDPVIRVMGLCFSALVVMKLVAAVESSTVQISEQQLACLSAILGTKNHDVRLCLTQPGAVQLAGMVSLALGDVVSLVTNAVPPYVLDVVQQTLAILSQALPAEGPQLDPIAQSDISDGNFHRIVVSRLHNLLQMCIPGSSPLADEVRKSCLRMCLRGLWYYAKTYRQLDASKPLSSYSPNILATLEITRYIQREEDRTSRVIGRCFEALVVTRLAADLNSDAARAGNQQLVTCLSPILGAESRMVEHWLRQPGAIEHMALFFLALGEVGSMQTSRVNDEDQSDVMDVVQQTFGILSHTLQAELNVKPWPDWTADLARESGGKFTLILQDRLKDLLEMCTIGTPTLMKEARITSLKSLWYYGIACHLRASGSLSAWDISLVHLTTPEIARHIHTERDLVARAIGRCFGALVVNTHAAELNSLGDHKLACISAILGTENREVLHWLSQPGAVQLVNIVSLALGEVSSFVTNTVPSDVLHIFGQTISVLIQDLPADLKIKLQLRQADILMNVSEGPTKSTVVSYLLDLLKTCTLKTLPLPEEIRTSCLQMCLNGLWHWGKALHQLGASRLLPPDFLDLVGLDITRHIRTKKDQASRVMGRCVEALVVNILATRIKSSTGLTVQISDMALGCLSAILGTESRDVMLWLNQPGAIELVNIVFLALGNIDSLAAHTVPSYILDVVPQTFGILSQALPAELNTELGPVDISDGTTPITGEIYRNYSIRCLKNLWHCVQAYNQPRNSVPLPSYVLTAFASTATTLRMRTERDVAARVMGRCIEALVVKKLVAGAKSSTNSVQISDGELAYLSTILDNKSHDVRLWLAQPGAVELASMAFSLALGDVESLAVNALPSDVLDVVQQTLAILSQALPAEETAELQLDKPINQLDISIGNFQRIIAFRLYNLLQMCIPGTSHLTAEMRRSCLRVCLKYLCYFGRVYNLHRASEPLPSYFPNTLASPEIIRRIQTEQDPVSRMMGRCFGALVVMKLSVGVRPRTDTDVQISDEELACLSAILSAESHDVEIWLRLPGTVALANMASLTFNEVDSLISDTMSSDLWDMTHQTLRILSQSLPAELNYEPRLDRTNALITIDHGQYECIVVSRLYSLFQTCTRQSPRLKEEVRTSCLRMCLKSLWNYGRVYHQLGASKPLPPHIPLALGGPEMTHRIHSEPDYSARVIGRCFEALIVNNLAACVESRTDSTVQISDKAMGYLSAILGTESHDLRLWHGRPGAVELANLVSLIFSEIDSLPSDTAPSDVLDMIQQTYSILSRTLPAELNAELMNSTDGMSPPTEPIYERRSRKCLKYLWYCARAYNQLGVSMPLPSFVLIALTNSEITGRIHTESDLAARVTGRCIWALIVYKLMDDFRPHSSSGGGVYGAELERISSVLGTRPNEFLRWPRPSAVIKLMNVISLVSGEIEPLFTSVPTPIDVLNMVQQTINIISPELILGGAFACGDLPMDQVLLLRETCSKIANAHAADLSGGQTAEILHQLRQISKQLPPVEY